MMNYWHMVSGRALDSVRKIICCKLNPYQIFIILGVLTEISTENIYFKNFIGWYFEGMERYKYVSLCKCIWTKLHNPIIIIQHQ